MPFFSIVMQSTLKPYPGAASNRPEKLVRAIESVIIQTFQDWELIIVADNCQHTFDIATKQNDKRIMSICYVTEKVVKWSSECRNGGKQAAHGNYVLYLDNDDYFTPEYLENLYQQISVIPATWYIADHYEWIKNDWKYIRANLTMNSAGTANIIHSSTMKSRWPDSGTFGSEDWTFIKRLMNESKDYKHLELAGYKICHKRGVYDV